MQQQNFASIIRLSRVLWLSVLAVMLGGLLEPEAAAQTVSFGAKTDFSTGIGPFSVKVADFNGDGKLDLVAGNSGDTTVSILLGTGAGSFGPKTDFGAGMQPFSVAVSDFNGDGKLDLAAANASGANVSILLGTGTGSFGPKTDFGTGIQPFSVAVGDFNGDGNLDLAVANLSSATVSILLGTGTGSFGAKTDFGTGSNPRSVAIGDFNEDGKLDLAVANQLSDTVSILLGTGTGSFGPKTDFGTGSVPLSVAEGDFNGDGKLDLAVANNSGTVSILLGTGTGSFGAKTDFGAGIGPFSVAVGDFNGDGKLDLAAANASGANVSILLGTGTGSFGAKTDFGTGVQPVSVAVGDLNGDGKLDLAVANATDDTVSILLNTTVIAASGVFCPKTDFVTGDAPESVAVGDFNGDGKLDLAVTNTNSDTVSILLGTGSGSFGAKTDFVTGDAPDSVAVGDFNGDGKLDLAVGNAAANTVSILLGTGSGSFGPKTDFGTGLQPASVAVGDFNGDGKLDLAVANSSDVTVSILLGTGSGSFGAKTDFGTGSTPFSVAVGDFNGDGRLDLVTGNSGSATVSILLGTGTGSFGPKTDFGTGSFPRAVAVGDFNDDGKLDLAVANFSSNTVSILLGMGTGSFGPKTDFGTGLGPTSVAVGHFNGDGKLDLAVANRNAATVSILLGTGTGGLGAKTDFGTGSFPFTVAVGDFNDDGKPDLAVANLNSDTVSILLNTCSIAPVSDLRITKSDSPDPVVSGSNITYTIGVINNGPDPDAGVTFTDTIPAGATFVSLSSPGSCTTPSPGGTGTVTCSLGALAASGSAAITLVVNVNAGPGSTITNTAMVSGMSSDPNLTNNSAAASTAVVAACSLTCPANITQSTDPNQCGAIVNYPPPTSGGCGTVTCTPSSGSFFPKGTTSVICLTMAGPSCSFTVTVNDTQPPAITCPPNQTAAANGPSVVNYPPPTVSDNCPGITAGCVPPSGSLFPVGTTTVTCTATDASTNTAICTFTVTVAPCTITCPPDLIRFTSPSANACGTVVTYSPQTSGACGPVICIPASGSVFAVGTTTVSCTAIGGPSCSFTVTVIDSTPPGINCSTGVTVPLPAGQLSAVVNYPAPTATDNCSGATVVCVPPSGSTFPAGATLVTCMATDASENANRCFFFVTLLDGDAPVIRCPANVNAALAAGQTSVVVNYPAPTVTDNLPGVNVVCSPPSGSSFPAGATTVTCTATDAGGNKSSCSFIVGVGGSQAKVSIPGNKTAVEFAATPTRKPLKPKKNPPAFFAIENIGFAPLVLTFDSIARTGSSVDSGRITDPNDTRFLSLSLVNSDQSLTPLDIDALLTLQPGQVQNFGVTFAALIPALAGRTTGLAASNVLPDAVTSKIVFRQNGAANIAMPILARVSTALVLINPSNPRAQPEVIFTRSGNDITVSYAVFDSNLDVSRAKYEFLDSSGRVVAGPFEVDLAASLSSANLVRGQSFSVGQRFTGASSHPEITSVQLTVFDGETSAGAPSTSSEASSSAASVQLMKRARRATLYPPDLSLRP